jgi:hypothetical protein
MNITLMGGLGVAAGIALLLLALSWVGTRRLLVSSRHKSAPLSVFATGWRAVFGLIKTTPTVAIALFATKLFQILGKDLQNIVLRHHPLAWSIVGMAIDLIFALAWAAFALRIYFYVLASGASPAERWARTRIAVIYAFAFWGLGVLLNLAGIGLVVWVRGADHGLVVRIIGYLFFPIAVVAVMTRPAIAKALPRPLSESFRILRENWFGGGITLALAALPLGFVFAAVSLISHMVRLKLYAALLLEVPIAAASALCYLAFEGVVAAMYRRIR